MRTHVCASSLLNTSRALSTKFSGQWRSNWRANRCMSNGRLPLFVCYARSLSLSPCHFRYFLGRQFPWVRMAKCLCASQVPWFELAKHIGSLFIWKRTNTPTNNSLEIFRSINMRCLDLLRPKHTPNPFAMWASSFWHRLINASKICMYAANETIKSTSLFCAENIFIFYFIYGERRKKKLFESHKKLIWHHPINGNYSMSTWCVNITVQIEFKLSQKHLLHKK